MFAFLWTILLKYIFSFFPASSDNKNWSEIYKISLLVIRSIIFKHYITAKVYLIICHFTWFQVLQAIFLHFCENKTEFPMRDAYLQRVQPYWLLSWSIVLSYTASQSGSASHSPSVRSHSESGHSVSHLLPLSPEWMEDNHKAMFRYVTVNHSYFSYF